MLSSSRKTIRVDRDGMALESIADLPWVFPGNYVRVGDDDGDRGNGFGSGCGHSSCYPTFVIVAVMAAFVVVVVSHTVISVVGGDVSGFGDVRYLAVVA